MKLFAKGSDGGFELTGLGWLVVPASVTLVAGLILQATNIGNSTTTSRGPQDRLSEYKQLANELGNHQSYWCRKKGQNVGFLLEEVTSVTPQTESLYESVLKDAKEAKCL